MTFRTDLALETREIFNNNIKGIENSTKNIGDLKINKILIKTEEAEKYLKKPKGNYITIEIPNFIYNIKNIINKSKIIAKEIKKLIPKKGLILVIGLGNLNITPDALGPKAAEKILATRHIKDELIKFQEFNKLRKVAVISPGVLGQTGIETVEIILSLVKKIKPSCIILIDALASRSVNRLGSTIQIADTGISPGSGVGNPRPSIDKKNMGIPVISIGTPTVVDAMTLVSDILNLSDKEQIKKIKENLFQNKESLFVTPREIDLLIDRAAKLIGTSINFALNSSIGTENLLSLT